MCVGLGIFKMNERENFFVQSEIFYICVLIVAFIYMCSPDDDISKLSKYRVQAA